MKTIKLDERLSLCASFVRHGSAAADIGTDHAYLPIFLIESGICRKVIAADINEAPLKTGYSNVCMHALEDRIELRLSDGLDSFRENEADDIIIAGMGGELIIDMISRCDFIRDEKINLILQPMTKYELLISYLYDSGFKIKSQKACKSSNKLYTVLLCSYCGIKEYFDELTPYTGKLDLSEDISKQFLAQTIKNLKNKSIGDKSLIDLIKKLEKSCANG